MNDDAFNRIVDVFGGTFKIVKASFSVMMIRQ